MAISPQAWADFSYNPPPETAGLGFNVYEWKIKEPDIETRMEDPLSLERWKRAENEAVIEICASNAMLAKRERKVQRDIVFVLGAVEPFRNHVKERQITHASSPQFMFEIQAALNHPILQSADYPAEAKRQAESVKESEIKTVQYTRSELKNSPHPEFHSSSIKDSTEAQKMREDFKRKLIAEPDSVTRRKKLEYTGMGERGYKEVEEEEVLEYKFARIERG